MDKLKVYLYCQSINVRFDAVSGIRLLGWVVVAKKHTTYRLRHRDNNVRTRL